MDETPTQEAEERAAPRDLALVQEFVNTNDIEAEREELEDAGALRSWLASRGLVDAGAFVGADEFERAVAVREAIRDLAEANHDAVSDPGAAERMNRVAGDARLVVRFDEGGARLEPQASGIDGAIGKLVAIVFTAMADGSWARFKVCRRDTCRWAFYDRSKNHSSSWCSMAVCGNKEKAKAYRRRRNEAREASA